MSRAAAIRFFSDHVGCVFDTEQTRPHQATPWKPGSRTLARRGARSFTLDGSTVEFTSAHTVTEVTDTRVTVEYRHEDGQLIHTTTYTLAPF